MAPTLNAGDDILVDGGDAAGLWGAVRGQGRWVARPHARGGSSPALPPIARIWRWIAFARRCT
jgi:hypothetical protein